MGKNDLAIRHWKWALRETNVIAEWFTSCRPGRKRSFFSLSRLFTTELQFLRRSKYKQKENAMLGVIVYIPGIYTPTLYMHRSDHICQCPSTRLSSAIHRKSYVRNPDCLNSPYRLNVKDFFFALP